MGQRSSTAANALIQATIFKKCDRAGHRPASNKQCANGTCQHTCEPAQAESCTHKWTVRYSVNSRQREQSFETLTEAQTFQLKLSRDKQTQGAMVFVSDDTVRILVEGIIGIFPDKLGRYRPRDMAACASRRGCSARWDCGSGKRWGCASPISRPAATAPATCTCAGRPAGTARRWSRSSTARPATSGTCPYRTWCGTWCKPC